MNNGIYLIEPYNPYDRNPKKKHPFQIAEEEALFYRMMLEAKQAEANRNTNLAVPQHLPPPSQVAPTAVGNAPGVGGSPAPQFFNPVLTNAFTAVSQTGSAPFTVTFINQGSEFANYTWGFGDGTTSTEISPVHTYAITGSYNVSLTASRQVDGLGTVQTVTFGFVSSSMPSMSVDFSASPLTASVPFTASFTNLSIGASTYKWVFHDGTTSSLANPTKIYTVATPTGSGVKLEATGSFNQRWSTTKSPYISASL